MNISRIPAPFPLAAVICGWACLVTSVAIELMFEYRLNNIGRDDLIEFRSEGLVFVLPVLSAAVVGSALALRRPSHPVGWLFIGLALAITGSGVLDAYTAYGAVARPGSLPAAGFVASAADAAFIPWLMLLAFILLLTPTGRLTSRPARLAAIASLAGGLVSFSLALLEPYRGDYAELGIVENPLAIDTFATQIRVTATLALIILHLGLLAGPILLVLRFRSSGGAARKQLRWLAVAAIPFPIFVVGAYVAATLNNDVALGLAAGGFVAVIPIAAGLAIEQDHLYDVDRLLSRGLTYVLLSSALIACYAVIVIFVSESLGDFRGDSQVTAVVATLATVSVALPLRRWLQDGLDRRFNRRQFESVAMVRDYVRSPETGRTVEQVLRDATGDERLLLSYWIDDRRKWVREDGSQAAPTGAGSKVQRRGTLVAEADWDSSIVDKGTMDAILTAAVPEIENARLRAAIALQLVEVRESRARIVEAQLAERRKLERNLHDGAQQRLLSTAMNLRVASSSSDETRIKEAVAAAVEDLQAEVRELRDIANGLHPSILHEGGLSAALDDLAGRAGADVRIQTSPGRFPPKVEEAAWFIACEALANAVKHAEATRIEISSGLQQSHLVLEVLDNGIGGANPAGPGLRGIADRAEALGGSLVVSPGPAGGTLVRAVFPCDA